MRVVTKVLWIEVSIRAEKPRTKAQLRLEKNYRKRSLKDERCFLRACWPFQQLTECFCFRSRYQPCGETESRAQLAAPSQSGRTVKVAHLRSARLTAPETSLSALFHAHLVSCRRVVSSHYVVQEAVLLLSLQFFEIFTVVHERQESAPQTRGKQIRNRIKAVATGHLPIIPKRLTKREGILEGEEEEEGRDLEKLRSNLSDADYANVEGLLKDHVFSCGVAFAQVTRAHWCFGSNRLTGLNYVTELVLVHRWSKYGPKATLSLSSTILTA